MARSKMMKKAKRQHPPLIKSLPEELVINIIACVGSSSLKDLFNVKQSCKDFYKTGGDNEVFRRISLEKLPAIPWRKSSEYLSFFKHCEENGNPEALFRHGMVEFFSCMRHESGVEFMKKAISLGCIEAAYVLGLILLCIGERLKLLGLELLKVVEKSSPSRDMGVRECRKISKMIIRQMWINSFLPRPEPMCSNSTCTGKRRRTGWSSTDDELPSCEVCRWDHETILFYNMLHGIETF